MPLRDPVQVQDMMGRRILIPAFPERIISLVPSITETLHEIGLDDRVVGITKFCIHPEEWFRSKPRVGGTKKVDFKKIEALEPDLIIANKEENTQSDIDKLGEKYPVWISDISTFDEGLLAVEWIGDVVHAEKETKKLIYRTHKDWSDFKPIDLKKNSCLYFIWDEPMMLAGKGTFIDDIIGLIGFKNLANKERYPNFDASQIDPLKVDHVFLSSEPFPFEKKHVPKYRKRFPNAKIHLVDGEMFSWYGSRMRLAPAYFKELFKGFEQ